MDAEEARGLYKDAFDKSKEDIVAFLQHRRLLVKLGYAGALTEAETARAKSSTEAASVIARVVVSTVREKDDLLRYIGFSNVVWWENELIGRELFPFADQLKGLHCPSRGAPCSEIRLPLPEDAVLVVWLVTCRNDRDILRKLLAGRGEGPPKIYAGVECQLFPFCVDDVIRPIYLCLAMQEEATLNPNLVASMLQSFKPAPRVAVLSGTCIANEGAAQLGDVVVVTRSKPWPIVAEVQHMTELWKLQGELMLEEKRPQSQYNQMVSLARLYLELKSPPEEQTQWFRELGWQADKPLPENHGFRRYVPDPEKMRETQESSNYWKPADKDVLPYAPVGSLLSEAKASMLYSYSCHPLSHHSDFNTVFGRACYFTSQKGTVVYSPEAVAFYIGAQKSKIDGLKFLAAMGVSEIAKQCAEPEFKAYAGHVSTLYMHKVVQYLASKLH